MTEFRCTYCQKTFKREKFYNAHTCQSMVRHQEKDMPGPRLGFHAYLNFYSTTNNKDKTFEDFINSPYYKAFVNFGKYCIDVKVLNTEKFISWLLAHNKRIDYWCKDTIYTQYLIDYIRNESVEDGLTRSIEHSLDWQDKTGYNSKDILRYGNINANLHYIINGKLSPWVIYCSESGRSFLSSLNNDQIKLIWEYIFPDYWNKRFEQQPIDYEYAIEVLKKAGW